MGASRRAASCGAALALALVASGCAEPPLPVCGYSMGGEPEPLPSRHVDKVDLLIVVDDSSTMSSAQQLLAEELTRALEILATGDRDLDGTLDFIPPRSIHVGVVSADMGAGDADLGTCAGLGDDGILSTSDCATDSPSRIFEFAAHQDVGAFSQVVGCGVSLGTNGCGVEQPLEAALKALSLVPQADGTSPVTWTRPGYRPPIFAGSTFGHGGASGVNDGFLRPDSVLAFVLLTDDDDCSIDDPRLFDPDDPRFDTVPVELRCSAFPDALRPVQRYVEGFTGLRSQPSSLVLIAVVGVPREAVEAGLPYDAMLDLEAMSERVDPTTSDRLLPSCVRADGRGSALPPRRIVELAAGLDRLGAGTSVQSICGESFGDLVGPIADALSPRREWPCRQTVLGAPPPEANRSCDVLLLLPEVGGPGTIHHCADMPSPEAFVLDRVEVSSVDGARIERELCRVAYVGLSGAGTTPGWYVDEGSRSEGIVLCGGLRFSIVQPVVGSEVRAECITTREIGAAAPVHRGQLCDPSTGRLVDSGTLTCATGIAAPGFDEATLICHPVLHTCELPCASASDCESAGLRGYACDDEHDRCVNPTCEALHAGRGPWLE